jgi:hypothetical protein
VAPRERDRKARGDGAGETWPRWLGGRQGLVWRPGSKVQENVARPRQGIGAGGWPRPPLGRSRQQRSRYGHSEMTANLLMGKGPNFRDFSERPLINHANQSDFDSAIPRFESWRPSQPASAVSPG